MNETFEFDKLPDSSGNNLAEGEHTLTVTNLEQVFSKTSGSLMFQFSYIIDGNKNLKLNFDNCPLKDKDGNAINFGGNKLKKIIKAAGVDIKSFSISTLKPLLIGKSFNAVLSKNEKGYLVLDAKNIDTIKPASTPTVNTQPTEQKLNIGEEEVVLDTNDNEDGFNW